MKKIILTILVSFLSLSAFAERYVMVTHGEGKDPFWPVVQKGGEDAARHIGADFEYIFNPSGDMGDMAKSIAAAAAESGLSRWIMLPFPMRPLKFLLVVEAQTSPSAITPLLMPRQAPQVGLVTQKPASMKILMMPSSMALV